MGRFIFGLWLGTTLCPSAAPTKLSFNRDIRSILSENCFKCHGPDGKKRKGKLRLDVPDGPEGALVER
ncbi:MAG: c-type cytochrome domain-containing protein, partial [Verrucomicrobiota bacterium]|nr:c-type cytochrome domain-containing protein [Verrucomicrobiota bacterium]